MTIRAELQPAIDEFIDNLHTFATGSYLAEDEKEFWDAPFDSRCLPELKKLLENIVSEFDDVTDTSNASELTAIFNSAFTRLDKFNAKNADAVVEPEEKQELEEIFRKAAQLAGADDEVLAELPEFE